MCVQLSYHSDIWQVPGYQASDWPDISKPISIGLAIYVKEYISLLSKMSRDVFIACRVPM